jgi:myo-inositol 2-dehydrogenase/D-chiro-inositol 1-dehydrogenase
VINIALFGAGNIGTVHARNVAQNSRCQLRYVVDQDIARAKALAAQFGGEPATMIDPALQDASVDAVIIASSTLVHEKHLLACISAGKAVLCEKPIADSLDNAKRCVDAAKASGIIAAVGFNRRLDPHHRAVHDRTHAGAIGKVELLHLVSRSQRAPTPEASHQSGGTIRDKGSHFFDLACWIAQSQPVEAYATGACLIDPGYARFSDVDTAVLTLKFESGALATFSFSRRTNYGYDEMIEVFGSEGMLESRRQPELGISLYKGRDIIEGGLHEGWYERFAGTYRDEMDAFVTAVEGKAPVHATLSEGLRAQAIAEAMIEAMKRNAAIAIQRIW